MLMLSVLLLLLQLPGHLFYLFTQVAAADSTFDVVMVWWEWFVVCKVALAFLFSGI